MGKAQDERVDGRLVRARELAGAVMSYLELHDEEFEGNLVLDAVELQRVEGRTWAIYAEHRSYCVDRRLGGECSCGLAELQASIEKGGADV